MKIVFTSHAEDKIKTKEAKLLSIYKEKILEILKKPNLVDKSINPHKSIGGLNSELSLVIVWKMENGIIKIITFYPAKKGRYERMFKLKL